MPESTTACKAKYEKVCTWYSRTHGLLHLAPLAGANLTPEIGKEYYILYADGLLIQCVESEPSGGG